LFQKAFNILEESNLNPEQLEQYQKNLYTYLELNSAIKTAADDGVEKGRLAGLQQGLQKGRLEGDRQAREAIARNLLGVLEVEMIALKTGLSVAEINALENK
jgi:predicted transposase/invertase (TIGR01784 family)